MFDYDPTFTSVTNRLPHRIMKVVCKIEGRSTISGPILFCPLNKTFRLWQRNARGKGRDMTKHVTDWKQA